MTNGKGGAKRTITVVEDNPADVYLLRHALNAHNVNYEMKVLSDGRQAMEYVDAAEKENFEYPELVILDLNLPVCGGLEVLEHIRMSPRLAHVRAVILTTSEARQDRERADALGIEMYLHKPTNLDDFIRLGAPLKLLLAM